jgi:adenosine deaminase
MAPTTSFSGYRKLFVAPPSCSDLNAYISYAQPAIELMQTKANLRIAAHDLVEQFREDRVVYGEIRFAPLEHCRGGLSDYEVVKVVEGALDEASKDQGIEAFLILCSLRPYRKADSLRVAELAEEFRGSRVVG